MFKWYRDAKVCYACPLRCANGESRDIEKSRWFSRGWTLQELIAPDRVVFYDRGWNKIGERNSMASSLAQITTIEKRVLREAGFWIVIISWCSRRRPQGRVWIAERITASRDPFHLTALRHGWDGRQSETTREEDMAYCLLGLFDVHMPLLYGGRTEGIHASARKSSSAPLPTSLSSLTAAPDTC